MTEKKSIPLIKDERARLADALRSAVADANGRAGPHDPNGLWQKVSQVAREYAALLTPEEKVKFERYWFEKAEWTNESADAYVAKLELARRKAAATSSGAGAQ